MRFFALILLCSGLCACAGKALHQFPDVEGARPDCERVYRGLASRSSTSILNGLSSLSERRCDREVLSLGKWLLEHHRDKVYSVSRETAEFFLKDGAATDYVLEGYERVYLSILMAVSSLRLGDREGAGVFLRRARQDQAAQIDNPTDDPVLIALQAALWENLGEKNAARPFWKRLSEKKGAAAPMRGFAREQVKRLDREPSPASWEIWTAGDLPSPKWTSTRFSLDGQIYDFQADRSFLKSCASPEIAVLSTESWFQELRKRHSIDRRPLTMAKGLTRGAIGVTFAATVGTLGLGVAVLGCSGGEGGGELCRASIQAAFAVAALGFEATKSYLKPDVRHWEDLPGAFILRRGEKSSQDPCSIASLDLRSKPLYLLTPPSSASTTNP